MASSVSSSVSLSSNDRRERERALRVAECRIDSEHRDLALVDDVLDPNGRLPSGEHPDGYELRVQRLEDEVDDLKAANERLEDEVEELREAQEEADRELRNDLEDQLRGPYRKWITNQVLAELEDE